ncbi:MAG: CDP-alcohol phosphatidyltransferase family protein [Phycisphaerae bacterium]|nr:CDP-alcohol phosphatidyltransferase family protein [Phycisphaerae bacterium]
MNWKLPNQLTVARIGLAVLFFVLLGMVDLANGAAPWLLNAALVVYLVAGVTDVLDGWIARKYNWTSAFGRIADPFVDKVLVLGAFIMLAGSNFAAPAGHREGAEQMAFWINGHMISAVQSWMVVVILCRELLVSAVRGYSESQGIKFPATPVGKLKMFLQSAAICGVLLQTANFPDEEWAVIGKIALVWLATVGTVLSGLAYVGKIRQVFRDDGTA